MIIGVRNWQFRSAAGSTQKSYGIALQYLQKLQQICQRYMNLVISGTLTSQQRGFELERVLYELFELFDLDPKASFRIVGEQIDGAFSLEGTEYLLEGKWQKIPVDSGDLDKFSGRIQRKLDNTLGLFLSINGFSEDGVRAHSREENSPS
jgi:hypothetical protein